ncbi:MAG: hypothetical protein LBM93_05070 [Oscillospiraceae bacterium]|jgi:hypothetical protein|nr:hypothetical protein [Oscillospiraceae bacterium]
MNIQNLKNSNDFTLLLPVENEKIRQSFLKKLGNRKGVIIEGEEAKELIHLYELYRFSDKVIIGSFAVPYGRKLQNLLDTGVADEGTLINDVILGAM